MGKASVIIYITIAIALLLLISRSTTNTPNHPNHRHRRLKLRSNFTFTHPNPHTPPHTPHIPFDPLVADIERKREDKQWEHHQYFQTGNPEPREAAPGHETQPEWEDFMDAEDYLNDQEKFNVTNRLVLLFPKIDVRPVDGFVSEDELTNWHLMQSKREVLHRTQRDMEVHDKNKDGFVSFQEYDPPSWVKASGGIVLDVVCLFGFKDLIFFSCIECWIEYHDMHSCVGY